MTDVTLRFTNHYLCNECATAWEDDWDCQVDDDCPNCESRHLSPIASHDYGADCHCFEDRERFRLTAEGHLILCRDNDDGWLAVETIAGETLVVRNVTDDHEDRERYWVDVDREPFTDQLRAPAKPGPVWSADPLAAAADAAASFYAARHEQ